MSIDAPLPLLRPAPPSFVADLGRHGAAPALVAGDRTWTYGELASRVAELAARLGTARRLVLLEAANDVDSVLTYLACLTAGHPVVLAPPSALASLAASYDPDLVVTAAGGWLLDERRALSVHHLHPDLALLLSTSGSTGSPKLVRLSRDNLSANAQAIASYLALRPGDVAVTTLPLGYCYGLSVLSSHLQVGAAVVLSELSVVDPGFVELCRRRGVTSFAGVPHTFELLERSGFAAADLPALRCVTQAGGRMAPERVRRFAELGQRRGWDLYVMYGATEATARMAYLPPELATVEPGAIGRPVPGGAFSLEPVDGVDEPGVGELVYTGPNVMLGYAEGPADLARGADLDRLRTGDLARRTAAGLYEVVGRRSRFAKVFGLRLDLQRIEELLAARGVEASCVGDDDALVAVVPAGRPPRQVLAATAAVTGLPRHAVRVVEVDELPRLANGKVDLPAVRRLAAERSTPAPARTPGPAGGLEALVALYAEGLDRPDAGPDDTFVGLGGDSLSYVEMSLRLEQVLGSLPAGWHTATLRALASSAPAGTGERVRGRLLETSVALRAAAIVLVVASHANLLSVLGGAHVLLGVAGYNFARFVVSGTEGSASRRAVRSLVRLAVPSVLWIAVAAALTERYTLTNVLLLNGVLGPDEWGPTWHYWFLEVLVYVVVACAALLAVPAVRRFEQRRPWAFALALLAAGTASRLAPGWLPIGPDRIHTAHVVFWLFALGWAAARATTTARRTVLTVVLLATVPGFFGDLSREAVVVAGLCALLWCPAVRVPAWAARLAGVLAAASLHVYVTHWLVYPHLEHEVPLAATVLSLAVGLLYREAHVRTERALRGRRRSADVPVAGS